MGTIKINLPARTRLVDRNGKTVVSGKSADYANRLFAEHMEWTMRLSFPALNVDVELVKKGNPNAYRIDCDDMPSDVTGIVHQVFWAARVVIPNLVARVLMAGRGEPMVRVLRYAWSERKSKKPICHLEDEAGRVLCKKPKKAFSEKSWLCPRGRTVCNACRRKVAGDAIFFRPEKKRKDGRG